MAQQENEKSEYVQRRGTSKITMKNERAAELADGLH